MMNYFDYYYYYYYYENIVASLSPIEFHFVCRTLNRLIHLGRSYSELDPMVLSLLSYFATN